MTAIGAATRVGAVIGDPVAHSLSPALQGAAFAAGGVDAVFVALRVAAGDLGDAVVGFRASGFLGVSVTVPHKQAVMAMCDRIDPVAARIGAVNCLEIAGGEVVGHNTDAGGFIDALAEAGVAVAGARAVLLGAGGAARAVHAGLVDAGAGAVEVVAREPARAAWVRARRWQPDELGAVLPDCDLVIDCTPIGLSAERERAALPVPLERLPARAVVSSLVYHREQALLAAARQRGHVTVDGAGMLVHQGARAFKIWTGQDAPIDAMWAAMRRAL